MYSGFECDSLGTQTITQLLLMEKEDFEKLPGYDTQKAQHMALYRFLLHSNKQELYKGTADAKQVAIKISELREKSETNLLLSPKKAKKATPRSPKRKIRTVNQTAVPAEEMDREN